MTDYDRDKQLRFSFLQFRNRFPEFHFEITLDNYSYGLFNVCKCMKQ